MIPEETDPTGRGSMGGASFVEYPPDAGDDDWEEDYDPDQFDEAIWEVFAEQEDEPYDEFPPEYDDWNLEFGRGNSE